MSRNKRLYTFLIAPTATARVRRFSIPHGVLYGSGAIVAVLLLMALVGVIRLAQHEGLNLEYRAVKSENEKLKRDNQVYENSYAKLKGQISFIEDMSKELARQVKMERVAEIDEQVGTGGPETVSALDKAADRLERDVRQIGDRLRANLLRLASIPTGMPVEGYVTDAFGIRRNPFGGGGREFHEGLDVAVDFGTPVTATADGVVIHAGPYAGYGNLVVLFHNNGITTRYGHLSKVVVDVGRHVRRGDQVSNAGSTGRSTGPHVHYEIRENDRPIDPLGYIKASRP